jgi:hypothetical protein
MRETRYKLTPSFSYTSHYYTSPYGRHRPTDYDARWGDLTIGINCRRASPLELVCWSQMPKHMHSPRSLLLSARAILVLTGPQRVGQNCFNAIIHIRIDTNKPGGNKLVRSIHH